MLAKCALTILELYWNQHLWGKKTKLNICHHMVTSSTKLQNWLFRVVERTRMYNNEKYMVLYCFSLSNKEICDFLVAQSSSQLLMLPIHWPNFVQEWKKFLIAWEDYALTKELTKEAEGLQITTVLTVNDEEARELYSSFNNWETLGDVKKCITLVLKKLVAYC